jgi:diguanylate cyclase (GGDEF)-like protein
MTNVKPIDIGKHVKDVVKYIKPVDIGRFGAIRVFVLLTAIITAFFEWKQFYDFFVPNGTVLNWRFVILIMFIPAFIVFLLLEYFWYREYTEHEITKKDRDNLKEALGISEERRLTDVITGVPNSESLKEDIKKKLYKNDKEKQCIYIDLKDFSEINDQFGANRTNDLLRTIAQIIYKRMRRDEKMYRVYPGGDEFIFIIYGDQADALGFSNRLCLIFKEISTITPKILDQKRELSFYCGITEMHINDSYKSLYTRAESVYKIAKEGTSDFAICWDPNNIEITFSENKKKLSEYETAHKRFQVMTLVDKDYGL